MPTRLLRALVFCAVLSLTLVNAYGQTKTWVGPNTGSNWNTATNWSPAGLPGYTDDVVIYHPTGDSVNLNPGTAAINSLTLGGSVAYPQHPCLRVRSGCTESQDHQQPDDRPVG